MDSTDWNNDWIPLTGMVMGFHGMVMGFHGMVMGLQGMVMGLQGMVMGLQGMVIGFKVTRLIPNFQGTINLGGRISFLASELI